jgi:hypothetical protein
MLNLQAAQAALVAQANNNFITAQDVEALLQNVRGTTLASITQVTKVATAAVNKARTVQKVTQASIQLFNNVNDFKNVYTAAVKRSANAIADNNAANVNDFEQQDNYFTHTNTFSLVQHKTDPSKFYLFAIYNTAESMLFIDGVQATKQEVAQLLTPSAAKTLMQPSNIVHNVTNDVFHTVQVRTIGLNSIVQLNAMKQQLAV